MLHARAHTPCTCSILLNIKAQIVFSLKSRSKHVMTTQTLLYAPGTMKHTARTAITQPKFAALTGILRKLSHSQYSRLHTARATIPYSFWLHNRIGY